MFFHLAVTKPINTSSGSLLTREQVWEGIKLSARDPIGFLPALTSSRLVEESAGGLKRIVTFKPGTGPPGEVTQTATFYEPVQARFDMFELNSVVLNIVSTGEKENEVYLTMKFAINAPESESGTAEAAERAKAIEAGAWQGLNKTIDKIRELVKDGVIA